MKTREKFKKAVIEAMHGLPYEQAIKKEFYANKQKCLIKKNKIVSTKDGIITEGKENLLGFPITIGRVMQALTNILNEQILYDTIARCVVIPYKTYDHGGVERTNLLIKWKLTKENGQECADDDQSDETIDKLLNLLK